MQQATLWPKVSAFLLKDMGLPAMIIEQLQNLTASSKAANNSNAWQAAAEQKALMLVSLLIVEVHAGQRCMLVCMKQGIMSGQG